jgi:CBS domain-containing protein
MAKTVADVMSHDPIMVSPQTPLKEAIKILAERRISGLPVVDDAGKLVGVISETDLLWQETGVKPPVYIMFLDSVITWKTQPVMIKNCTRRWGKRLRK